LSASTASTVPAAATPSPGRAATDGNTLDSVFRYGVVLTNHIFFSSTAAANHAAAIANGTTTTIGNSSATTATHSGHSGMAATHRRHGQRLPAHVAA
jgi:hypothetical protein